MEKNLLPEISSFPYPGWLIDVTCNKEKERICGGIIINIMRFENNKIKYKPFKCLVFVASFSFLFNTGKKIQMNVELLAERGKKKSFTKMCFF